MTEATPVQLLRSSAYNRRPTAEGLLSGQPAVNINAQQPGLFFADDSGTSLFKVGPCSIGLTPPNNGAVLPGALGNCVGELWPDLNDTPTRPGPALRVWDGTDWIDCMPSRIGGALVSDVEPPLDVYPEGTMWWDSNSGLMYVVYDDGLSKQWTQVSSATVLPQTP